MWHNKSVNNKEHKRNDTKGEGIKNNHSNKGPMGGGGL